MQKIINDPTRLVDDMLEGILAAYPDRYRIADDPRALVRAEAPIAGKVAIVTGGGSGHLPLFLGYVGEGLVDGCAVGEVFASPSSDPMLACARATDAGRGVLFLIANYSGDVLNFEFAAELAQAEGLEVALLAAGDDVASAPRGEESRRRGIAGIVFLYKVAGAAAAAGWSLEQVRAVTERAAAQVRSMGVALAPCTIPAAGRPTFEVAAGQMEIGMGIHGEPGVRQGPLETAEQIGVELTEAILTDLDAQPGDAFAVLVNGLGATPPEELHALFRTVAATVTGREMTIERTWIGEFATSLEMAGASVSLLRLSDELRPLLASPVHTPFVSLT